MAQALACVGAARSGDFTGETSFAQNRCFFSLFASLSEKLTQNKGFWGPLGGLLCRALRKLCRVFSGFFWASGPLPSLFWAWGLFRALSFWTSSQPLLGFGPFRRLAEAWPRLKAVI